MKTLFLAQVEEKMLEKCRNLIPERLYQPIDYTLSQGGKRIRPLLVAAGCELFGGNMEHAVYPAAAFEMLHNFTLIHDDVMDDAPIRRGQPTVYRKYNANTAILSGDALFALAMERALDTPHPNVLKIARLLAKTSVQICEGQQYDLDFETIPDVSIEQYIEMIRLKTSVLLGACLNAGALLTDASEQEMEYLYLFGVHLGIAFQLKDDLLDVYADEAVFGKQNGGDIKENKKTYLYLKALELASGTSKQELKHYFASSEIDFALKYQAVKQIYEDLKIRIHTERLIQEHTSKALDFLNKIKVSSAQKEYLEQFGQTLIHRVK